MSDLQKLFSQSLKAYDDIENFEGSRSCDKFNLLIQESCSVCKQAMDLIDTLGLFSQNESLEELTSTEIKYLIFPALYGYFLSQRNGNRKDNVHMALLAYGKFRTLCADYNIHYPEQSYRSHTGPGNESLASAAALREAKINRYKKKTALREKLRTLASLVDSPNVDEEVKRDYNLILVYHWLYVMEDEVNSLRQEENLLSIQSEQLDETDREKPIPKVPFQPFIIARDAAQAAVFGAGYPSLPTMSLDQFFSEQVRRGNFPAQSQSVSSKPETGPSVKRFDPSDRNRAVEEEKAAKDDDLADADDPERLARARDFDDFKDTHRRGCGHRINQG